MKIILVAILINCACVASALGREWKARSGGYTVEAELVGVKDGNAVLKKKDGKEIAVPLSKLSLRDVGYINNTHDRNEHRWNGNGDLWPAGLHRVFGRQPGLGHGRG